MWVADGITDSVESKDRFDLSHEVTNATFEAELFLFVH